MIESNATRASRPFTGVLLPQMAKRPASPHTFGPPDGFAAGAAALTSCMIVDTDRRLAVASTTVFTPMIVCTVETAQSASRDEFALSPTRIQLDEPPAVSITRRSAVLPLSVSYTHLRAHE